MAGLQELVSKIESGNGSKNDVNQIFQVIGETSDDSFDIISMIQEQDSGAISDFEKIEEELEKILAN